MVASELRRQLASLLVIRASGHRRDSQRRYPRWELANDELRSLLEAGVGGVILLGGSAEELRLRCEQLRSWAQQPLLLCADVEEGVGQRFEGASWLVPPLSLAKLHVREPQRAIALAERYGRCTGRQARLLGLNWVLGPVCDVNNNPANPVINVRAWAKPRKPPEPWPPRLSGAAKTRGCWPAPNTSPATATPAPIPTWSCRSSPTIRRASSRSNYRRSAPRSQRAWAR